MIAAAERACEQAGMSDRLHVERFTAGDDLEVAGSTAGNTSFDVYLSRAELEVHVPADRRLIEVLRDHLPGMSFDCEKGYCGACETRVLAGTPEHRDSILTDEERAAGRTMMICVGRCRSGTLVLDL
jgi:ferredoxin